MLGEEVQGYQVGRPCPLLPKFQVGTCNLATIHRFLFHSLGRLGIYASAMLLAERLDALLWPSPSCASTSVFTISYHASVSVQLPFWIHGKPCLPVLCVTKRCVSPNNAVFCTARNTYSDAGSCPGNGGASALAGTTHLHKGFDPERKCGLLYSHISQLRPHCSTLNYHPRPRIPTTQCQKRPEQDFKKAGGNTIPMTAGHAWSVLSSAVTRAAGPEQYGR